MHHLVSNAAQEQPSQAGAPVSCHDDEPRVFRQRLLQDRVGRRPFAHDGFNRQAVLQEAFTYTRQIVLGPFPFLFNKPVQILVDVSRDRQIMSLYGRTGGATAYTSRIEPLKAYASAAA